MRHGAKRETPYVNELVIAGVDVTDHQMPPFSAPVLVHGLSEQSSCVWLVAVFLRVVRSQSSHLQVAKRCEFFVRGCVLCI